LSVDNPLFQKVILGKRGFISFFMAYLVVFLLKKEIQTFSIKTVFLIHEDQGIGLRGPKFLRPLSINMFKNVIRLAKRDCHEC
jgi:hypothetical protein